MSETVGDFLLDRLGDWGVSASTDIRATGSTGSSARSIDRATGGDLEFIQVRHEEMAAFMACAHAKFTGEVGRLPGDLRPGRDPPAQRPVRREDGPRPVVAIVGHRRDDGARRQVPAGSRPAVRCSRTSRTSTSTWRSSPAQIRHLVDRALRIALGERTVTCDHRPQRRPGARRGRRAAARARHGPLGRRLLATRVVPCARDPTCGGRRHAQRGRAGRDAGRRGRAGRRRRSDRGRRRLRRRRRQGAARQSRACPTICRSSPARSACSGTTPSWRLMRTATRCSWSALSFPYSRVPAQGGAGPRRADRHRRRACSACAIRSRSISSATRAETLRALLPLLERKTDRVLAREHRRGIAAVAGRSSKTRAHDVERDPINPQLVFFELSKRLPPTAASSPPTRARRPTGTRATSRCAAG